MKPTTIIVSAWMIISLSLLATLTSGQECRYFRESGGTGLVPTNVCSDLSGPSRNYQCINSTRIQVYYGCTGSPVAIELTPSTGYCPANGKDCYYQLYQYVQDTRCLLRTGATIWYGGGVCNKFKQKKYCNDSFMTWDTFSDASCTVLTQRKITPAGRCVRTGSFSSRFFGCSTALTPPDFNTGKFLDKHNIANCSGVWDLRTIVPGGAFAGCMNGKQTFCSNGDTMTFRYSDVNCTTPISSSVVDSSKCVNGDHSYCVGGPSPAPATPDLTAGNGILATIGFHSDAGCTTLTEVWTTQNWFCAPDETMLASCDEWGNVTVTVYNGNGCTGGLSGTYAVTAGGCVQVGSSYLKAGKCNVGLRTNELRVNEELLQTQYIASQNGQYFVKLQPDGNLVVYSGSDLLSVNAQWASDTNNQGTKPYRLVMQSDRNLVLYDSLNVAKWASGTNNQGTGLPRVTITNDGRLVVYDGMDSILWQSCVNMGGSWTDVNCAVGSVTTLTQNGCKAWDVSQNKTVATVKGNGCTYSFPGNLNIDCTLTQIGTSWFANFTNNCDWERDRTPTSAPTTSAPTRSLSPTRTPVTGASPTTVQPTTAPSISNKKNPGGGSDSKRLGTFFWFALAFLCLLLW